MRKFQENLVEVQAVQLKVKRSKNDEKEWQLDANRKIQARST